MNQVTKFDGTHEDLIHDVAFNYYGNRLGNEWPHLLPNLHGWPTKEGQGASRVISHSRH